MYERMKDEEQKEAVLAEIQLTYEEILQLEQALIELDEQSTKNTLEIRKCEAKTIYLMKQVKEIEEMLESKKNASSGRNEANKLKDQIDTYIEQTNPLAPSSSRDFK